MGKGRLEAFSDGVIAILITIMVLELRVPAGADLAALRPMLPVFISYVLSFIYLGIYWTNHHHMLHATERIDGRVLWANLHLLFWLSLVPFVTNWMGDHFEPLPVAAYGVVLMLAGVAYYILLRSLVRAGHNARLAAAVGRDAKSVVSICLYAVAIGLAFASQWTSAGIYVLVAMIWLVPDRRIESRIGRD
jgi:uncharacterized membrane protein